MELRDFLNHVNQGRYIEGGSEVHQFMHQASQDALRLTMELNSKYHEPEEIREIFSRLIGKPVPETFGLFPPFTTDFGKNITVADRVFINAGCRFQDHGGITIGAGTLIGHNVVLRF